MVVNVEQVDLEGGMTGAESLVIWKLLILGMSRVE